jgi:hypothetical protein
MSRHWKPVGNAERTVRRWPDGALAGLALVAVACAGVAALLYHVAGPRDVFEEPAD